MDLPDNGYCAIETVVTRKCMFTCIILKSIIERFGIRNRIQVIQYELNNSFEWYTRRCIFIPLSGSSDFPQTIHVDCGKTITCSTQQHNETDATTKNIQYY